MARPLKYEALVSAKSRDEAIEIASEAISPGRTIVRAEAEDASQEEGPDSYRVTIWFQGGSGGDDVGAG